MLALAFACGSNFGCLFRLAASRTTLVCNLWCVSACKSRVDPPLLPLAHHTPDNPLADAHVLRLASCTDYLLKLLLITWQERERAMRAKESSPPVRMQMGATPASLVSAPLHSDVCPSFVNFCMCCVRRHQGVKVRNAGCLPATVYPFHSIPHGFPKYKLPQN